MRKLGALLLCLSFSFCLKAQLPVPLGTSASFGVLAGSTVTNTGPTIEHGNLGVSPGSMVTGFPPGIVLGGSIFAAVPTAATAQNDSTTAYLNAQARPCPGPALPGNIGGLTMMPGVYCTGSSVGITGNVTLNGNGNPNAVFIFQIGTTLTTAAGNSQVILIGGAQASNVFWQVGSSATLGTNTIFNGTILALASITLTSGAVLNGRALAQTGAVTLAANTITAPVASGGPLSLTCSYPSGQVGVPYTSALAAAGGIPPYTYSIVSGSLPAGLTLNPSTGAITGTPTTSGATSNISQVIDSTTAFATSSCGITIAPATPVGLTLICASNSGQVGQPYVSSLVASGGTAPYTYSISAGNLPSGLTLNASTGVISGTPTTAGPFNYTARVVDSTTAATTSGCGPFIVAGTIPSPTPAPPTSILTMIGLGCAAFYVSRKRLSR
jgi:hypothetical protein